MRCNFVTRGVTTLGQHWHGILAATQQILVPNYVNNSPVLTQGSSHVSAQGGIHLAPPLSRQLSEVVTGASSGWERLQRDGVNVNPCRSPHHPAALEGIAVPDGDGKEMSVQEAYNPDSMCFGCGRAHPDGLRLQSRRMPGGGLGRLEATIRFSTKYCAFPGIVNGGVLTTALDCHGNWAAAIALMDKGCLPRPPLTMTASMQVSFREPTPPDTDLQLRSRVLSIRENTSGGPMKATVEVEVVAVLPEQGPGGEVVEKVMAVGTGVYKRRGALRSLLR